MKIPDVVEQKAAETAWAMVSSWFHRWFHREGDQQTEIENLKALLADERSGRLAHEKMRSELMCRSEDDHMYWKKDGSGGPFCPLCLDADMKRVPLIHGNRDGSFYCNIHKQYFETEELRQRKRQALQREDAPRRARLGPHSWMAR